LRGLFLKRESRLRALIEFLLEGKARTYDLGGFSSAMEIGKAIAARVKRQL
jgi:isocitrate/isopropylmalate dehydrogenase